MRTKFLTISILIILLLVSILFLANTSNNVDQQTRKFSFTYSVNIPSMPEGSKDLEIFIPIPKNDNHQNISDLEITTNVDYKIVNDPEYNNKLVHINLSQNIPDSIKMEVRFIVERQLYTYGNYSLDTNLIDRFLMPDSLVPIDGIVEKEAKEIIKENNLPEIKKAELLYKHVVDTMTYDKKTNPGWGKGDVLYACDARTGNCTDFHSLFIGLSRAEKIPSRFVIGFPIPENKKEGKISGYHCWAEFYVKEKGWIPIDASEAFKNPQKQDFFFGSLDPNRVSFTIGRDIPLKTGNGQVKKVNYLIYPYVLINNENFNHFQTEFSFKDLN